MMKKKPSRSTTPTTHTTLYAAFLIRMWQAAPDAPWSASAQSVETGDLVRFGSIEALFDFLDAQTNNASQAQSRRSSLTARPTKSPSRCRSGSA